MILDLWKWGEILLRETYNYYAKLMNLKIKGFWIASQHFSDVHMHHVNLQIHSIMQLLQTKK